MSCATSIGSWPDLVTRLDADAAAARWAAGEPVLRGLTSVADLDCWTDRGQPHSDAVFGALVRLAAADCGDDPDAALVVMHLLWPALGYLIRRIRTLECSAELLVAGQAAVQIRSFPWRRRTGRFAANLLLDIQGALTRELRCHCRSPEPRSADVDIDSLGDDEWPAVPGPDHDDLDVYDLLTWAMRTGVVSHDDVRLIVELEYAAEALARPREAIATARGCSTRNLDRQRHRALAALRAASPAYLAAVA